MSRRRLSESISEGDGISFLVTIAGVHEAAVAEAAGAKGLVLEPGISAEVASATALPLLVRGESPESVRTSEAAAWLLVAEEHADELEAHFAAARDLGLECVVDVQDEDELEHALAIVDPEIILLSPRGAEDGEAAVDRVLELLPDVPAGKLAVAELADASGDDVLALERAGVDAVLIGVAELGGLRAALELGP